MLLIVFCFMHTSPVRQQQTSAWFYDTIGAKWIFLATLRRPNCTDLICGLHSFLENFNPEQGDKTRKAYYSNVWIKPKNDNWKPVVEARLTNDLTGRY